MDPGTNSNTGPAAAPTGDTRRHRWTAIKLAVATALLFLAPGPVLMGSLFLTGVALLATPVVYWLRRERFRRHLGKLAVRTAFLALTVGLIVANVRLADARLKALTGAVHAYHDDHDAWPADLADLAPKYVARVPRATLWLTMNRFSWHPAQRMLTCVPTPPIGWIGHDFDTDSPVALD